MGGLPALVSVVVGEACFKIDCDLIYSPDRLGAFFKLVVDAFARSSETRLVSFAWICVAL